MQNDTWQLQEAKAKLSAVIDAAWKKPQKITVRGEETAYVVSAARYNQLTKKKRKMSLEIERHPDKPRKIDL
jgi:prevent-host-death family protein